MPLPDNLEPAIRDPRKLRLTAWILVAIMIVGGGLIFTAYQRWSLDKASDTRPAVIHRIKQERDLRIIRQDGKTHDLFELRGKVWAVHLVSTSNPQLSQRSLAVMKRLAAKFSDRQDFQLVTLVLDPIPAEQATSTLANYANENGMQLPQWWVGTNETKTLHRFVKSELKGSLFPHLENERWLHDSSIVLIDRGGHLRRAVIPRKSGGTPAVLPFDFEQAASWDAKGLKSGSSRSNEEELEAVLQQTIQTLLTETTGPS
jgi:cytochrome oxidase Cu insertion factor (SCO1/SenC/PrrC family)